MQTNTLRDSKLFKVILLVSRFGLAALFLFAAAAKLSVLKDFSYSVAQLLNAIKFDPVRWTWPVTFAVIGAEIVIAVLLLVRRTTRVGGLAAAALLVGFSAFALYYRFGLGYTEGLECNCFGKIIGSQLGVTTALRNLVLLIPTLVVFFGYRKRAPATATNLEQITATS
ncbi:MAG TPA: MauE/DoxX family redox-associated membrane protein [Pyrinomonadaceae bacterium]|nr:MauE/DoxX family redox-associated membrane protein [Pyrinomonadaceae bacterium]